MVASLQCPASAQPYTASTACTHAHRGDTGSRGKTLAFAGEKNELKWRSVPPSGSRRACPGGRASSVDVRKGIDWNVDVTSRMRERGREGIAADEVAVCREGGLISWRQGRGLRVACAAGGDGETQTSRLASIIKNKQRILESQLSKMSGAELESRLSRVEPMAQPYKLLDSIATQISEGRTAIILEVARSVPSESPERLAERCVKYVEWGATALAICTDEESSPNGLSDLTAVCQAVSVPVLRRDWIIHPLQIAETREAGADALTAVYTVLSKGLPVILNYMVSLGLDAVVEVINLKEMEEVATLGIPIYGINLSVGLALSMPGIRRDISKSLIGEIPFGASSMVGVYSIEEARAMKLAGADAVYVRHEVLQGPRVTEKNPQAFIESLRDAMTGDD